MVSLVQVKQLQIEEAQHIVRVLQLEVLEQREQLDLLRQEILLHRALREDLLQAQATADPPILLADQ
jgi:hypothetical protein